MSFQPDISIVIPVFNEEKGLVPLYQALAAVIERSKKSAEIVFVDDGSRDGSFAVLSQLSGQDKKRVRVVKLARNFGHQLAISAGLAHAKGKAAIVMDADMQDPPEVIIEFVRKWEEGFEVVYGVRSERMGETYFKKATAELFYKMIRRMTNFDIPANAGDFYLLDRKVIDILNALKERHRFMRGLVAWVGYKRIGVPYQRKPRLSGETKYSLWKMVKFSFDAITSFSFAPLRFVSTMGMIFSSVAFFFILVIIYMRLFTDVTITGWSSLMAVILFLGGIQLLSIGIIGEYIARIGDDVKARPLYNVSQILE